MRARVCARRRVCAHALFDCACLRILFNAFVYACVLYCVRSLSEKMVSLSPRLRVALHGPQTFVFHKICTSMCVMHVLMFAFVFCWLSSCSSEPVALLKHSARHVYGEHSQMMQLGSSCIHLRLRRPCFLSACFVLSIRVRSYERTLMFASNLRLHVPSIATSVLRVGRASRDGEPD